MINHAGEYASFLKNHTVVVSQATGGKFANGAMTGAFIHLFNAYGDGYKNLLKGAAGGYVTGGPLGSLRGTGEAYLTNMDAVNADIKVDYTNVNNTIDSTVNFLSNDKNVDTVLDGFSNDEWSK
jgi:hypothetical protein